MPNCSTGVVASEFKHALHQLGTLGGGNHFIEIQKGDDGFIWLMIHSGSRNLGFKVAKHYNDLAIKLNKKWHTSVPADWQLAFLPLDSIEGQFYMNEMQYCVDFALANRALMTERVKECIANVVGDVEFDDMINIAHNYAAMENHFNTNVMVHRKGATRAYSNQPGIIPGSQGTASYIVQGKGELESFMSCSHGAGRKMGRKQAQRELDFEEQKKILDALARTRNDLIHNLIIDKTGLFLIIPSGQYALFNLNLISFLESLIVIMLDLSLEDILPSPGPFKLGISS